MRKKLFLWFVLVLFGFYASTSKALTWSCKDIDVGFDEEEGSYGVLILDSQDPFLHKGFIALPGEPSRWVLEGKTVYVLCPDGVSQVIACDLETKTVKATMPIGNNPVDLVVKGNLGVILQTDSPSLTLFDASNCTINQTIPLQARCQLLEIGEKTVYAYRQSSPKAIEVLDLETLTVRKIHHRSVLGRDSGIEWIAEHQGQAWAFVHVRSGRTCHALMKIDLKTQSLTTQFNVDPIFGVMVGSDWFVDHVKEGGVTFNVPKFWFACKMTVHEGRAYGFHVSNGTAVVKIFDIGKNKLIRSFEVQYPYWDNTYTFSPTHLKNGEAKQFPLYPTPERLDKMRALNKRRDYAGMCIGAFKGQGSQQWGRSQDKLYGLLSTTASYSQQLIYDFLHPAEILYALSQTRDNKYLRSTEWRFFRKELLQKLYLALWMEQKEEAHMLVGLFLDIDDPEVKGLYKEFGTSYLYAALRRVKKKLSESVHPRVFEAMLM